MPRKKGGVNRMGKYVNALMAALGIRSRTPGDRYRWYLYHRL